MLDSEATQVTLLVTAVFDSLNVPYVIGGSMASIVHGLPRTTMDVDIVADMKPEKANAFVAAVQDQFYVDEPTVRKAVQQRTSFNLIHLATMFKVDIFLAKPRAFDQQQLTRRIALKVETEGNQSIWVLSAEDVVLAKLDWFRLGGKVSERQWRDIIGILKTQQNSLDLEYLQHWAQSLHVTDLLERALKEI